MSPVYAHWADMAALEIDVQTHEAQGHLTLPTPFLKDLDHNRDQKLDIQEIKQSKNQIEAFLNQHIQLNLGKDIIPLKLNLQASSASNPSRLPDDQMNTTTSFELSWQWSQTPTEVSLSYDLFPAEAPKAHCLVSVQNNSSDKPETLSLIFDREHLKQPLGTAHWTQQMQQFVSLGLEHIVTGYDHLLFLLALLLVSSRLPYLLKIVTAFTVAHSLTLTLASLQLVQAPSRWVESLIAASILYVVCVEVLWKRKETPWYVIFGFGLIHGLGFASMLGDLLGQGQNLALALVSFNLGLELGQLGCILLMWGLLQALNRKENLQQAFQIACSVMILVVASYWFFERAILGV